MPERPADRCTMSVCRQACRDLEKVHELRSGKDQDATGFLEPLRAFPELCGIRDHKYVLEALP